MTLEKERNHNEDIRTFIESQLRFEEDVDANLLNQIRDEILEKSSGVFLWVNLVVHQLNEVQRQDGRMTLVQQRLREIPEAAKKRPAPNGSMPLYGLFQDIIQKDQKNVDELVRITQIIFCARRPLHPKELYVLLHEAYNIPFDSNEISDTIVRKHVTEISKGLAEVTKSEEPTVQFIHETVIEFLRDGGLNSISTQSVECDGHEILKASCLKQIHAPVSQSLEVLAEYLCRGHYRNSRIHKVTRPRQKQFQEQANDKFPFLEYATKNVLFHADESEGMGISQSEFLENFPIAEWVPIHNLFEKYNTRRLRGATTPILYILAENGCDQLIKSYPEFTGQYAKEVKGNEFSSPLACAICNGNLSTAWTLVGLEARSRPQASVEIPRRDQFSGQSSLFGLLLRLGDVQLMKKVLEDGYITNESDNLALNYDLFSSLEIIDLFLEVSDLSGFPSVRRCFKEQEADQGAAEIPRSNTDLKFLRRAIEERPSLLESEVWGRSTMLNRGIRGCSQAFISLYLEYSTGGQSDLDHVLHIASAASQLSLVTYAHLRGANLRSRNNDGQTALHLAADGSYAVDYEGTVRYLISNEASCVNARDFEGRTPLAIAAQSLYPFPSAGEDRSIKPFLQAGADPNTLIKCQECPNHEMPLIALAALRGDLSNFHTVVSDDRCNLDGRDSFGRTALSWCFVPRQHNKLFGHVKCSLSTTEENAGIIGERLLQEPAVDVNSRDDSSYTILEHFIRKVPRYQTHYSPGGQRFRSSVRKLFQSNRLDPNLLTSNGQSPLELIVSLYDNLPADDFDFGGLNPEPFIASRQQISNQHLIEALKLLLGTRKVDIDNQRRCAEQTAPELRSIILGSIESMS